MSTVVSDGRLLWLAERHVPDANDAGGVAALCAQADPMLQRIARRYRHLSYEDALQEARLAFVECIHQFDAALGIPFEAYAVIHLRGAVRTAMRRWWVQRDRTRHLEDGADRSDALDHWMGKTADLAALAEAAQAMAEWPQVFQAAGLSPRETLAMQALMAGVTMPELATACGVSAETAKTWRKRAIEKLRNALSEEVSKPARHRQPGERC